MKTNTDELIQNLARDLRAVHVLRSPWIGAAKWLAFSGICIGTIMLTIMPDRLPANWPDSRFALGLVSALLLGRHRGRPPLRQSFRDMSGRSASSATTWPILSRICRKLVTGRV
jgi:hypothetical protein